MMVPMYCTIIQAAVSVTSGKLGPFPMLCFRSSWCWKGRHPCSLPIEHNVVPLGCICVSSGSVSSRCRKKMVASRFGELEDVDRLLLEAKLLWPFVVHRECE